MKIYADNKQSAEQLLEIAFTILRNEGQQPVHSIALVYKLLTRDIDVTTTQQAALHGYLRQALEDYEASKASPNQKHDVPTGD